MKPRMRYPDLFLSNGVGSTATRMQTGLALLMVSGIALIAVLLVSGQAQMDFSVAQKMSMSVKIHASSAILALVLGGVQLVLPKGRTLHMVFGVLWVLSMILVAGSSLFIQQIFNGSFSPIHLFVPLTAFGLYRGLKPLLQRKFREHGKQMRGVYFGALVIAGLFTFIPGRTMWNLFFGG
ncbi:hypothetical protein MNBD_ALPHA06-119 [hydrothermal vent metagenome]|uniref:DUF2306 domain-containing protein n=1 Tax=hydrothermal vent metagenome TaxID=652676 RepID=A0A3B0R595_9ZZZZ